MFELNVGTTPCSLTAADYKHLAELTEGYDLEIQNSASSTNAVF